MHTSEGGGSSAQRIVGSSIVGSMVEGAVLEGAVRRGWREQCTLQRVEGAAHKGQLGAV